MHQEGIILSFKEVKQEIIERLDKLPPEVQRRVLDYVKSLACTPEGTPGCELLRFSGIITEEDAQAMSQTIEEGCEQVNTDEW